MSADGLNAHAASLAAAVDVAASATRPGHAARGPAQYRLHVALIALAFGALALGALLYAVARPHAAAFLPPGWHQPVLVSAATCAG